MDGNTPWPTTKRFSNFFRKAILELDDQLYPGCNPIEVFLPSAFFKSISLSPSQWSSFRSGDESDGFTITRPGKRGCCGHTLRLQLLRHQSPERFVLSPDLYEVLAPYVKPTHGADDSFVKADISLALWQYIKDKDLMQVDGSRAISNDAAFQRIFECSEQPIHALMGKLQKKLTPVGPVSLEFDLKSLTVTCLHENLKLS
ncbi:hypothetical protein DYB32_007911 [Aphanomyces invadans]|uniref:DM2 domain-containing protein n=1 Tax=Aphanomyces invadans TaxID=157072 RepID=A0A418AMF0_9STRA|nr:hypothetical protein DYB32_007911 [Aphanomyces invadans]